MLETQNPLPDYYDVSDLKDEIIPYLGNNKRTSHHVLTVLHNLLRKSTTYRAVMKDLKTYSFGHGVMLVERPIEGLITNLEEEDCQPIPNSKEVGELLKELNLSVKKIVQDSKKLFESYQACGNMYYHIKLIFTAGVWKVYTKVIPYRHIAYKKQKNTKAIRKFYVSPNLVKELMEKNKKKRNITEIAASSVEDGWNWTERPGNVFETVRHFKNDLGEGDFYGETELLCALERFFVEISEDSNACNISSSELISKILLVIEAPQKAMFQETEGTESEGDEEPDAYKNFTYTLKQLLTTKGGKKSSSVGVVETPNGSKEPKVVKLEANRDTEYSKHQIETSERKITALLCWAVELTGLKQAKSSLGGNLIADLFNIKNVSTIEPIQHAFEGFFGEVIKEIFEITGNDQYSDIGIKYPGQIEKLVAKLSKGSTQSKAEKEEEPEEN